MSKKVFHTQYITTSKVNSLYSTVLPNGSCWTYPHWVWIIRDENGVAVAKSISTYKSESKAIQAAEHYDKKLNFRFIRNTVGAVGCKQTIKKV